MKRPLVIIKLLETFENRVGSVTLRAEWAHPFAPIPTPILLVVNHQVVIQEVLLVEAFNTEWTLELEGKVPLAPAFFRG